MDYPKPIILISACIEHSSSRYDATMISSKVVKDLKKYVNFLPICPELEIGLLSPREPLRLSRKKGEKIELISSINGLEFSKIMNSFTDEFINEIKVVAFDGIILKAKSPTCGIDKIKIYDGKGKSQPIDSSKQGFFAKKIIENYNYISIESERRLTNYKIRENFYIKIFTLARYKGIVNKPIKELVNFHMRHKYLFMTYNQDLLTKMGSIIANKEKLSKSDMYILYSKSLTKLFETSYTKKKRINAISHIYGYFKDVLPENEKSFYLQIQNDYIFNHIPFSTPLTILKGYCIRFNQQYLLNQLIFEPFPKDLITQLDSGKNI